MLVGLLSEFQSTGVTIRLDPEGVPKVEVEVDESAVSGRAKRSAKGLRVPA